jgi:hypothetical protein
LLPPLRAKAGERVARLRREAEQGRNQRHRPIELFRAPCEEDLELVEFRFGRIVAVEVGGALKLLDYWMQRAAGVVGRALEEKPGIHQTRLANPRLAGQQDYFSLALFGLPPSAQQQGSLLLARKGVPNVQADLKSVEQQLDSLSHPRPPRPVKTVRAALAATRVPPGIWRDSRECAAIQESAYFAKACAQVVQLRTELTAAEDYERLSARAKELRKSLAETPITATSDPLPKAFSVTLGRLLPVGGTEGVAMLLALQLGRSNYSGREGRCVLPAGGQGCPREGAMGGTNRGYKPG